MKFIGFICLSCICSLSYGQRTAEELVELGYKSYENREYEQAIRYFDQAGQLDESNPEIYYLRGACWSVTGDNKQALVDLNMATTLKPDYAEAWYEKGYIHFLLNNPGEAIKNFSTAIKYNPSYAEAYLNRGTVKCMVEDIQGAREDYAKAKELGINVPFSCD